MPRVYVSNAVRPTRRLPDRAVGAAKLDAEDRQLEMASLRAAEAALVEDRKALQEEVPQLQGS